jgi:hypothetical protein
MQREQQFTSLSEIQPPTPLNLDHISLMNLNTP